MRATFANWVADTAKRDENFLVLSGDHGYALFDEIRRVRPGQFLNVGVAEQMMVGLAAGLSRQGFRPLVYGLAAFVPIRVLEQIKLDVCYSKLPVLFVGDGAGLVYSTLGASHQSAEDVACLRPLPDLRIYSPCDSEELKACLAESREYSGPSYLRMGKGDLSPVHDSPIKGTKAHWIFKGRHPERPALIATGSMVSPLLSLSKELDISLLSVPRLKPFPEEFFSLVQGRESLLVVEEHSRYGGLASAILDAHVEKQIPLPKMEVFCLEDRFSEKCGSYQYALSEHHLSLEILSERIRQTLRRSSL
jgi:transketolase